MPQAILIVHESTGQGEDVAGVLKQLGHAVRMAAGSRRLERHLQQSGAASPELLLVEVSRDSALAAIAEARRERPELPDIAYSARHDDDLVDRAVEAGADDFVILPTYPTRLRIAIANALKLHALSGQISRLRRRYDGEMGSEDLIGNSAAMRRVGDLAQRAATSNISVLIEGESGVGKEMVARAIQGSSDRVGKPFVAVNCGAIPENLVESILFGHEKGAFTGASARHLGKFQEADGGTLFLDEIGELRPEIQVKLLRALQEGEIDPIGSKKPRKIDIRLISATNRNLAELVAAGGFREDLYYRLNVFPISVPPLRKRREDIPPLVHHFIALFSASEHKDVQGIDNEAMRLLCAFSWPGNVRQLENMIYRAVVLADNDILTIADFPQLIQMMGVEDEPDGPAEGARTTSVPEAPLRAADGKAIAAIGSDGQVRSLQQIEAETIRLALTHYKWQMSEVARRLGIGRSTLYRKVREHSIEMPAADALAGPEG